LTSAHQSITAPGRWTPVAAAALLAACSGSSTTGSTVTSVAAVTSTSTTAVVATTAAASTTTVLAPAGGPTTLEPIDPTQLIPIALGSKPFPAPGDDLATQYHAFPGDPNATLQLWKVMPMAVPNGPDVRLLGFERTVGISSTTATYLVGSIDPQATVDTIATALAPAPTYTTSASTRTEGNTTVYVVDAQPTTVQGDPPGWSIEASSIEQLGVVRIKRNDYTFEQAVPTFDDIPAPLQSGVTIEDAIAVNSGGVLSSISYNAGIETPGDRPTQRIRLTYELAADLPTADAAVSRLLTIGWDKSEQTDAIYFTSATTSEVWTLDAFGGTTHLTYDTGS
jgi:hypothetical protein